MYCIRCFVTENSRFSGRARAAHLPVSAWRLLPILLFFVAFLPRLVAVNRYVTPDEAIWVYRSIQFREALLAGEWAATLVAGHPGVTTAWLGALGLSAQLLLAPELREAYTWLTTMAFLTPDNVEAYRRLAIFLSGGRVAVALVNSLGVVAIALLARKLWGRGAALLAGAFVALDPFLLGLSGLLHVDGLSATFATLSLLATAVAAGRHPSGDPSRRWAALGGATAALAVLTKTPTLALLPVCGLALLWPLLRDRDRPLAHNVSAFLRRALAWGVPFLLTLLLLFPALWASPAAVIETVTGSANRHLDEALRETFFLGRAAFDHGPSFYPVVLLWRLSPVVWLALIPAVGLLVQRRRAGATWRAADFPLWLLLAWALFFVVAITPAAKKFDRYILPVVPSLLILSAVVWARFAHRRAGWSRVLPAVALLQAVYWVFFAAYPLAAYNPLVGGPWTAARVLPVGWGEGIGAAGRHLSRFGPDAGQRRALAGIVPSLAPFFDGAVLVDGRDAPDTADYLIVTLGGRQLDPSGFAAQIAGRELVHTERFGGLEQAWAYRLANPQPPPLPDTLDPPVLFGEQMSLTAYSHRFDDDRVEALAVWRRQGQLLADQRFTLRIVTRDAAGNIWATQETDLLNEVYFHPPDWPADETGVVRYALELPPGIPPASYTVALSLIDGRTAGQLPVRPVGGAFQGVAYEAGRIEVEPPVGIVSASRMQIPHGRGETWLDGRLQLLGHGDIPAEALAGGQLPVDIFWHVPTGVLPDGMAVAWHLLGEGDSDGVVATEPLSRYDTGLWRTGESIQEKYLIPLPPALPPGRYRLAMQPLLPDGQAAAAPLVLAALQLNNIDRLYEPPDDIAVPLRATWRPLGLLGASPAAMEGRPGETAELVLYWQKQMTHGDVYTVFVHVLDEAGGIVLQADHWPGGLPTDILGAEQIVIDHVPLAIPDGLAPGAYPIRIGLYAAESGARLPLLAADGGEASDDALVLPVLLQVTAP